MVRRLFTQLIVGSALCAFLALSSFAQTYPPPSGGGGGGTTSGSTGGGYGGSGAAIGAGVGAAAGVGILYLAMRNRGSLLGCIEPSADGVKLLNEKDKNTYALLASNTVVLTPGERVELKGKKVKARSGNRTFRVQKLAKNYGPCKK